MVFYDYSDKFKGQKAIETLIKNQSDISFNFDNTDIDKMEPMPQLENVILL